MKIIKIKHLLFFLSVIVFAVACEGSFDFNKEQYRKIVYLLSDKDEYNTYERAMANLDSKVPADSTIYITIGVSGSNPAEKDIAVELEQDDQLWSSYNHSNFDTAKTEYLRWLPKERYQMQSLSAVIPKGASQVSIPVVVNGLYKLSPDSVYVLNYRIKSASGDSINPKKRDLLLPVYWKNRWTNTKNPLSYSLQGDTWTPVAGQPDAVGSASGSPQLFPLTKNSVRLAVGDLSIDKVVTKGIVTLTRKQAIENNSMVFTVTSADSVKITPYKPGKFNRFEQLPPLNEYNNTYKVDTVQLPTGGYKYFKTFKVRYRYKQKVADLLRYYNAIYVYEFNPNFDK